MRPRPATRAALLVDVPLALSPHNAVRRLPETAFPEERWFLGALFKSQIYGPESTAMTRSDCSSWRLNPSSGEDFPRRPQRPVPTKCVMRHFALTHSWEALRQFTLENRRKRQLWCNRTAHSRHRTSALAVLCLNNNASAIENPCSVVNKLWRTALLCGNHRKNRRESARNVLKKLSFLPYILARRRPIRRRRTNPRARLPR
jgi:hypothetical protein